MRFSSSIHYPRSAIRAKRPGFALPMTIIAIAGLTLLLIGLLTVLSLERKTARSYSDAARADLAVESGLAVTTEQITSFLKRPEVTGAAFATWAYHPGGESTPGYLLALTSGRPEFDIGTTAGSPYLSADNTIWLGTTGDDPDELFADFTSGSSDVIDFNAKNALGSMTGACLARWQNFATDPEGRQLRYAVWVDDESSRIDVTQIGTEAREDGSSPAEIPFFEAGLLAGDDAAKQAGWRTGDTAGVTLGDARFPTELSFVATAFSRGYDVLAHTPGYAQLGASDKNGHQLPLRGRLKRNLNWSGHLSDGTADERVERLTEWMANGAEGFFKKRNLNLWPHVSGGSTLVPDYTTLPTANPFASNLRMEQFRTISASLIDYLDPDNIPTQPTSLAALNFGNPQPGASPVRLMDEVPRPGFFGADRTIRINEVQIIWNSLGAQDNFKANIAVNRTTIGPELYQYEIPVTFRFELWNMDENAIPAMSYEVRTTNSQQILGAAFGGVGALPIPEDAENVFPLNSGNPIAFAPNEIKVFNITRIYVRDSTENRGNTWAEFKNKGGDLQPKGTNSQAHVLLNAGTGEWLHATNNVQMSGEPAEGVVSAGVGNAGPSKGNRVNDPRMTPLRMYIERTHPNYDPFDRDWASNSGGKMGFVNNGFNGFNYQDFNFWLDRPHLLSINSPLQGITRVENRPMRTVGELGRIFDPSWTHPVGRGGAGGPYNRNVLSPFKGGGTLAVGQASKGTVSGTTEADHLEAKPWNIMDIFTIKGDASSMNDDEFGDLEWRGRINLNSQKNFALSAETKSNHEMVMELPDLGLGAAGRPTEFDFKAVATELKSRLTKGAIRPDGSEITDWKRALPLYSPGQLSELETWSKATAFKPTESSVGNDLKLLNRSGYSREEAMMRTANLVTTRSHCYRILIAGEVIDRDGKVLGRRVRVNVIFFNCTWDADTGELKSVKPEILYVRSL
jgi:hypothetical protein